MLYRGHVCNLFSCVRGKNTTYPIGRGVFGLTWWTNRRSWRTPFTTRILSNTFSFPRLPFLNWYALEPIDWAIVDFGRKTSSLGVLVSAVCTFWSADFGRPASSFRPPAAQTHDRDRPLTLLFLGIWPYFHIFVVLHFKNLRHCRLIHSLFKLCNFLLQFIHFTCTVLS